ncbi:MAG: lipase family protein [bacterium]|nr:lipase family protein [bacterium]
MLIMNENSSIHVISRLDGPINAWGRFRKSLLFAELSGIAYLDETDAAPVVKQIGFPEVEFIEVDGTQAYLLSNDVDLVIACRGTESQEWNDIKADLNAWPVVAETIGRVHRGFKTEVDDLWPRLEARLEHNTKELWLCGHSLGGAMATICATRCKLSYINSNPLELFTYGSPKVGTKAYVTHCRVEHIRWVNNNDIVTRVPPAWMGYYHVGEEMYLNMYGQLRKMNKYQRMKDRWRGFVAGLRENEVDHFTDHAISRYIRYIHQIFLESDEVNSSRE